MLWTSWMSLPESYLRPDNPTQSARYEPLARRQFCQLDLGMCNKLGYWGLAYWSRCAQPGSLGAYMLSSPTNPECRIKIFIPSGDNCRKVCSHKANSCRVGNCCSGDNETVAIAKASWSSTQTSGSVRWRRKWSVARLAAIRHKKARGLWMGSVLLTLIKRKNRSCNKSLVVSWQDTRRTKYGFQNRIENFYQR